jgi:iron complex transport system substrate-binding protein
MRSRIAATGARVAGRPRPPVLMIVGRRPLVAVGDGTLVDECLRLAGGDNVAAGLGPWPRLGVEEVVRAAPAIVIESAMGSDAGPDPSFWSDLGLEATTSGKLRSIPLDEVLRPGPRLPEGIERLARAIHPEAFP